MKQNNNDSDIAVIKNTLQFIQQDIGEIKAATAKVGERITATENKQAGLEQKISGITIFQSVFSIIIGGIATYLGGKR